MLSFWKKGNTIEASKALKDAEKCCEKTSDQTLLKDIYRELTILNCEIGASDLALQYAHKQLSAARKDGDNKWIAYAYLHLAIIYGNSNQKDSAKAYLDRCVLFSNSINTEDKAFMYNYIGEQLMNVDTSAAKSFLDKALEYTKIPEAYFNLAQLYREYGDMRMYRIYADSALSLAWPQLKIAVLESLAQEELKNSNLQHYSDLMQRISRLKDSINNSDNARK